MKKRSEILFDKSVAAAISAIELYNKPDFKYREESFIILLVNAWELLLKAKILQENNNKLNSLYFKEAKKNKKGEKTKKLVYKLNRSKGKQTIDLFKAIQALDKKGFKLDERCYHNIEAITEIRDNAIHLCNSEKMLNKKIQELGTASLKNYLQLVKDWFEEKLSKKLENFNFYLMPMSFFSDFNEVDGINLSPKNKERENLIKYLATKEKNNPYLEGHKFQTSVMVGLDFSKSDTEGSTNLTLSKNSGGIPITLSEEDMRKKWPFSYEKVIELVKKKKPEIKINKKFHAIKAELEKNNKLCKERYLDPNNKISSLKKKFYNENFPSELIKGYEKQ